MLLCITYSTIPDNYGIDEYSKCIFNIDMEKLKTVNAKMHDWILNDLSRTLRDDKTFDQDKDDLDKCMYDAIVEEACTGTSGCVTFVCKDTSTKRLHMQLDERKIDADLVKIRSAAFASAPRRTE
jgi:hypothetical protein